jgi:hypothetical protein
MRRTVDDRRRANRWLLCRNHCVVLCDRGGREVAVPGCHDEIGVIDCDCGCEVDGVVATQRVPLGEVSCHARERVVESDHVQLLAQLVDR